ncbi:IS5 family transposase [Micromonospora sp. WMMD723]|uniref:IS5 family transposase n=1 Tax=Micromonospora sp. WMMD723 TaxID=3403465 RepID=UPI003CEC8142
MLPSPQWMGRPEKHPRRAIIDGILYVVRTGCAWRYLPIDFPPWQTVYSHFQRWNRRGVTDRIPTELREEVRLAHDRQPQPTAGIIDSQSVRAADTVHRDTCGYDSGKKVNGRKRFIVTDTLGLLVTVWVLAASWQDRDGAKGDQQGFVVHRRRWVVERTLAWITAHRRLARDYETRPATSEAMIRWAAIAGMLGRLTRGGPATRQQRRTLNTPD